MNTVEHLADVSDRLYECLLTRVTFQLNRCRHVVCSQLVSASPKWPKKVIADFKTINAFVRIM